MEKRADIIGSISCRLCILRLLITAGTCKSSQYKTGNLI